MGGIEDVADALLRLEDDQAVTVVGIRVLLDLLGNDEEVAHDVRLTIEAPHASGRIERDSDGTRVWYEAPVGFVGTDIFRYGVTQADGQSSSAEVAVEVQAREWALVGPSAYEVIRLSFPEFRRAAEAFDVGPHGVTGSSGGQQDSAGFLVANGAMRPLGRTPSRAYHASGGLVAGVELSAENSIGLLWSLPGGAEVERVAHPDMSSTELFAINRNQIAVGRAFEGTASENAIPLSYHRKTGRFDQVPLPAAAAHGTAYGIDDRGTVVGAFLNDGASERAFRTDSEGSRALSLPESVWSRAYDIGENGSVVGTLRREQRGERGFVLAATADAPTELDLHFAAATWLLGAGERGELVGTFVDPAGYRSAYLLQPIEPSGAEVGFAYASEPLNASVAHACTHSLDGPFRVLHATPDSEAAPNFTAPHTSYTVFVSSERPNYLRFRSPAPGPVSFFLHTDATLSLYTASGESMSFQRVQRTRSCPKISWSFQFIAATDDYTIEIAPSPHTKLSLILERSWAFE